MNNRGAPPIAGRLQDLMEESSSSAVARQRTAFDEQAAPFGDRLVLFGAGGLGQRTLLGLRQAGVEPLAFTDNHSALWGRRVEGLAVPPPDEAALQWELTCHVVPVGRLAAAEGRSAEIP